MTEDLPLMWVLISLIFGPILLILICYVIGYNDNLLGDIKDYLTSKFKIK